MWAAITTLDQEEDLLRPDDTEAGAEILGNALSFIFRGIKKALTPAVSTPIITRLLSITK